MSEAATGLGGLLFGAAAGIFASFVYPSIKILRSKTEYENNGASKFSGSLWLFLSPLFGLLSSMLYQVIFAFAACSAGALQSKITNSVYLFGIFVIYALAVGLAVLAFVFKNWKVIRSLLTVSENRCFNKMLILICVALMGLLAAFFAAGAVVSAANTYFEFRTNVQKAIEAKEKLISAEKGKFNSYVGTYKLITRNDSILFLVSKSSGGKGLRLNSADGESTNKSNDSGCLLTPQIEENSIRYAVSECVVDGKESPLEKVYFQVSSNKTKMIFVYGTVITGDTLEKIN